MFSALASFLVGLSGAMAANAFCVHHHFLIQGVDPANAFCVHHHFLIRRVVDPANAFCVHHQFLIRRVVTPQTHSVSTITF